MRVNRNASDKEIKRAYRELAMQYHPDKNPGDKEKEEKFKDVGDAHAVLSNPKKRAEYDNSRSEQINSSSHGANSNFASWADDIFYSMFGRPRSQTSRTYQQSQNESPQHKSQKKGSEKSQPESPKSLEIVVENIKNAIHWANYDTAEKTIKEKVNPSDYEKITPDVIEFMLGLFHSALRSNLYVMHLGYAKERLQKIEEFGALLGATNTKILREVRQKAIDYVIDEIEHNLTAEYEGTYTAKKLSSALKDFVDITKTEKLSTYQRAEDTAARALYSRFRDAIGLNSKSTRLVGKYEAINALETIHSIYQILEEGAEYTPRQRLKQIYAQVEPNIRELFKVAQNNHEKDSIMRISKFFVDNGISQASKLYSEMKDSRRIFKSIFQYIFRSHS